MHSKVRNFFAGVMLARRIAADGGVGKKTRAGRSEDDGHIGHYDMACIGTIRRRR